MSIYFYLILGIASVMGIGFSYITRNILYHGPNTDNELMAYAATQSSKWRWPSDIHKYGLGKTGMKDAAIMLLVLFQRLMGNKKTDHPYTTLTGFAVSISTILIYLIGANFWSPQIGFFMSLLYIFTFWPWEVALYGGHINIGTTFFLASLYLIQKSIFHPSPYFYLAFAGGLLCCAMFSSASSMKFLITFWGAIFYSQYHSMINNYDYIGLYSAMPIKTLVKYDFILIFIIILMAIVVFSYYKKVVKNIYDNRAPLFLRGMIKSQDMFTLDHYQQNANKKLKRYFKIFLWIVGIPLFITNTIGLNHIWPVFFGFVFMLLFFTLPNVKNNILNYFLYIYEPIKKTHFRVYIEFFAKRGITVQRNTRGIGWPWVPRLFWRLVPIHMILFLSGLIYILILRISQNQLYVLPWDLLIVLLSTAPIWWAEFTGAPQGSRSYSPALTISLLFIGYLSFIANLNSTIFVIIAPITLCLIFSWNLWIFLSDVYPSRMGAANLVKSLNRLNIKEFYTYKTGHNKSLIEAIPGIGESEYLPHKNINPPYIVHYIQNISQVKNGWIVIPCTSSKASDVGTDTEIIKNGDYTTDPVLNKLIESKEIEKISVAKIKTYGTSRIWSVQDEVLGYRDLVLHDIGPKDNYRGYAWLFHSDKLKPLK